MFIQIQLHLVIAINTGEIPQMSVAVVINGLNGPAYKQYLHLYVVWMTSIPPNRFYNL